MSAGAPPFDPGGGEAREALAAFLAAAAGAERARVAAASRLGGGAIHEHWRVDAEFAGGPFGGAGGAAPLVLRAEGAAPLAESHGVAAEFAIARAAFEAGVATPEPLWIGGAAVLGRPFAVYRFAEGAAAGHLLVRDGGPGGPRPALLARIGAELARIQAIAPARAPAGLAALPEPAPSPALAAVAACRAALDAHPRPRPALEWGLRWLEREAPETDRLVLVHGDYRTGNFLVGEDGLRGVLDWEFARWGDPLEDPAWFSARCWRFGRYERRAGGLGGLADFERGYGRALPPRALHYWETMAHARWAVIALRQGERHAGGRQPSLELALTGRIADEAELELLTLIEEGARGEYGGGAPAPGPAPAAPAPEAAPAAAGDPLGGAALLDAARAALDGEIAPHLPAERRYALLMAGNAMGIAARELAAGDAPARRALAGLEALGFAPAGAAAGADPRAALREAEAPLAAAIRAGRLDGGAEAAARLRARALDAVRLSNPRFLARRGWG